MTNVDEIQIKRYTAADVAKRSNALFSRDLTFDTLPHTSPFVTEGLRYAAPPVEWDADRQGGVSIFSPTSSFTFSIASDGSLINAAFPVANLIGSQQITVPSALLAVSLSYATLNVSLAGPIGLYVAIDDRPSIGVGGNADILVAAITPNGASEQRFSDIRSNSFSLDVAPLIRANQSISLYASCANNVLDKVWGIVSFKYVVM